MSAERQLINKEKELLERKIQEEKTGFELKLQRSFENEMQQMKYMYELKLREVRITCILASLKYKFLLCTYTCSLLFPLLVVKTSSLALAP